MKLIQVVGEATRQTSLLLIAQWVASEYETLLNFLTNHLLTLNLIKCVGCKLLNHLSHMMQTYSHYNKIGFL